MILPKDVKGRNRIRNSRIINLYLEGNLNTYLIASKFHISQPRVIQIVKANAAKCLEEKDWNKLQRLNLIKQDLNKKEFQEQILSKKDLFDLWRKEFEGERAITIENKQMIQVFMPNQDDTDSTDNLASSSRAADSISEE